jgi:hypothetical protein
MPFAAAIPSASSSTPLPTRNTPRSLLPSAAAQNRASSRPRVLATPSAHHRCDDPWYGACAPHPKVRPTCGSGSGRERPSPCSGSHWMPRSASFPTPAEAVVVGPARTPTRSERERRFIELPKEPSPNRDARGPATHFAPHKRSPNEGGPSMLPPTMTRRHRWMETTVTKKRSCSRSLRDADKRPAATFDQP